ncbi:hypothetical protein GGQ54_000201 [Naumannella cuiyingiana]|uniref:Elongation factor G-binding protein C-terminal treble-clef zinc-finger domain-containing protein n=1 Tax=Naumannella cuiyingiana TaxID=1347891 RepID=A0A7Z0D661_9ACTN|nr:FBP domain-containing protein [Naumannella cuiyingiana]NYI69641.1 hypothetical protein [Naumannella cuiyingiana]
MEPITAEQVRASFVNTTRSQLKKLTVPADLATERWDDLDFLGWRDPKAPQQGYLVAPRDGGLTGVALRTQEPSRRDPKAAMCSLCLTVHPMADVALFAARRSGPGGRRGDTVGTYICANLRCPLYVRGVLTSEAARPMGETLSVEAKIIRLRANVDRFVDRVLED